MTAPDAILRITRTHEAVDAVQAALASGTSLRLRGGGSKAAITQGRGRPRGPVTVLDLSGCSGITAYEPAELVLSLRAGTPLREVQALLAEHRQMLAFEPPDLGPLLGHAAGQGSIGGAVASGMAGPRRISAGNVRDHLLGFHAVSGRGEAFKAGGRVIKNVTGYDLAKLVCGSWGTLVALAEITLRVLPQPAFELSLLLEGQDEAAAVATMGRALGLPLDVSGAAHRDGLTVLRLEGTRVPVLERAAQLEAALGTAAALRRIEGEESAAWWRALRDGDALHEVPVLWQLSVPASRSAAVVAALAAHASAPAAYDWGGSRVWFPACPADAAQAAAIRAAVEAAGGHATLLRGPAVVPVFHPQPAPVEALSRRVKQGFDPHNLFGHEPLLRDVDGA